VGPRCCCDRHRQRCACALTSCGEPIEQLLRKAHFFVPGKPSVDRDVHRVGGRQAEEFWHERWRHDKAVRCTHGVNCTGSCSWEGLRQGRDHPWKTQQTGYPSVGPGSPEHEPRGCARGASFSWYTYSPSRVRHPYVRRPFWRCGTTPGNAARIPSTRGSTSAATRARRALQGLPRQSGLRPGHRPEVTELIAAAHIATTRDFGPDRVVGFSPIPAMSQVSYSAGTRFLSMIGGTILSFYDWYADLPPASPQVFGDQTDVPESDDWWNSSYVGFYSACWVTLTIAPLGSRTKKRRSPQSSSVIG
jgi:nitrate reductase / nitrite oxidoreductase, alpha subunit